MIDCGDSSASFLENLDLRSGPTNNETTWNKPVLLKDEVTTLACEVRATGVVVERNGTPIINWKGDKRRLSHQDNTWDVGRNDVLYVGSHGSFHIHSFTLTPITGEGRPLYPSDSVEPNTIDLLKLVDVKRDGIGGRFRFNGDVLERLPNHPNDTTQQILRIPIQPPDEYDLTIALRRWADTNGKREGHHPVRVQCVTGQSTFELQFCQNIGWGREELLVAEISVRKDRVTLLRDQKSVIAFNGDVAKIGGLLVAEDEDNARPTPINDSISDEHGFAIEPKKAWEIHSLNLTPVSGQARLLYPDESDPDRAAAEWVLGLGGKVETDAGEVSEISKLATVPFKVVSINLMASRVTGDQLVVLKGLTHLTHLHLAGLPLGDSGLKHISEITSLQFANLANTRITSKGVAYLSTLTNLTHLHLSHNQQIDDEALEYLKELSDLEYLRLENTSVSDTGLQHLHKLTTLTTLSLGRTQVTSDGVSALKNALPDCDVSWDRHSHPDVKSSAAEPHIDLLKLIDLQRDSKSGENRIEDGVLIQRIAKVGEHTTVNIPYIPPEEYDLTCIVRREGKPVGYSIGLVGGGRSIPLVIGGAFGHSGLRNLDGKPYHSNETSRKSNHLSDGKEHTIVCRVRRDSVVVTYDGTEIIDWRGDFTRFEGEKSESRTLHLSGGDSATFYTHKLELSPVSGQGRSL